VGYERGDERYELVDAEAAVLDEAGEGGVVVLEYGDRGYGGRGLAEVLGQAEVEEVSEEGEG